MTSPLGVSYQNFRVFNFYLRIIGRSPYMHFLIYLSRKMQKLYHRLFLPYVIINFPSCKESLNGLQIFRSNLEQTQIYINYSIINLLFLIKHKEAVGLLIPNIIYT